MIFNESGAHAGHIRASLLTLPSRIIRETVSYLAINNAYDASERGAPALVALSTTCRLLSEHALDQLWGQLPSFAPLILAMPTDLVECKRVQPSNAWDMVYVLSFRRQLVSTDYASMVKYAARVRSFQNGRQSGSLAHARASPEVWRALRDSCPIANLFPDLRKLNWSWMSVLDAEQGEHGQLHLLASPGLREVRLSHACLPDVGSDEVRPLPPAVVEACTAFVSKISHVAPDVAVFEIEFSGDVPPIRPMLSTAVIAMHNLTTFTSLEVPLLPDAFLHLTRCPRLHTVAVRLHATEWFDEDDHISPQLCDQCLPALRSLALYVNDVELCVHIIKSIKSQNLASLTLALSGDSTGEMAHCLEILKDRPFAPQLRTVKVNVGRLTDHPPHIVHADDLAFLFPLDLHHVIVKGCDIAVHDKLVREMSEAWPNIRTLHLSTIPRSHWKVSLPGLLPLVYRCRSLTELWVNLDAAHVAFPFPITEIRPAFGSEQHSLRLLSVQYGRVADPAFVAGFLADCFPQCQIVYSKWGPAAAGADLHWVYHMVMWKKVGRLIPHFVKVRAQERRGAAMAGLKVREPANPEDVLEYVARLESDPSAAAMIAAQVGQWQPRMINLVH
ncbi:hypothetical protein OH76DRAFT_1218606 [Lentinus brumalis]|uniref:F-box domain-containing protein n=1 Tax=Lentinus brumalis TaxID=2498619 RepID=A0A371DLI8_9APHY|nr:hypothetical protein OH76DRAFT_1218606 [Polyporus brumalis]